MSPYQAQERTAVQVTAIDRSIIPARFWRGSMVANRRSLFINATRILGTSSADTSLFLKAKRGAAFDR